LTLLGAGTLVAAILALYVARPVRRLIDYVQAIRDGRRGLTPPVAGGEIGELTRAFEEMREALEGKKYIERYVQTLTHELKSPVTAIRGAVEVLHEAESPDAQRHFLENIEREVERIQGLAEQLLVLSSLQTQQAVTQREELALNDVLEEALQSLSGELEARNVSIRRNECEKISVSGNRFWLREAIKNIVRNAVEFSPGGEAVEINLERSETKVTLLVRDRGPGIPDWAIEKVANQFFSLPRPSSQRHSSGLGLSIVKEVIELHDGELVVANREGAARRLGSAWVRALRDVEPCVVSTLVIPTSGGIPNYELTPHVLHWVPR
jgi:two-component system sensor histidine kinase CreC